MLQLFANKKFASLRRGIATAIVCVFLMGSVTPPAMAQLPPAVLLPQVGTLVGTTLAYRPPLMLGLTVHPENPLQFDFIIDGGDANLPAPDLSAESTKLINYFLTALTLPEDQLWVNLSPYEKDRVIPDSLARTEMGRDMLAQDYLLKQLTASLMYPEDELGQKFWDRIIQQAYQRYGTTEIPTNTFNKIWIIPEFAQVYARNGSVFVVDSHLNVMLEEDYLALEGHTAEQRGDSDQLDAGTKDIIREIMIPEIEREINTGKNFAQLRQIFNSMILAVWYKKNLKESVLGKIYVDRNLVKGVDHVDPSTKQDIYDQYIAAFKKGVFNYVKEDIDPATHQAVPRKYFSGGVAGIDQAQIATVDQMTDQLVRRAEASFKVRTNLATIGGAPDQAMAAEPVMDITTILTRFLPEGRILERQQVGKFQILSAPWRKSPAKPEDVFEAVVVPFNEQKFHFGTPADPGSVPWVFAEDDIFWEGELDGVEMSFIQQRWPYALNHFLIVPQRADHRPQVLKRDDIHRMVALVRQQPLEGFRLAFNSLKAGASINHMHWHGFTVPEDASALESAEREPVTQRDGVRISRLKGYGSQGLYFSSANAGRLADEAVVYIQALQRADIAHAVVVTPQGVFVLPVHGNIITTFGITWSYYELMGFIVKVDEDQDTSWVREEDITNEMKQVALNDEEFRATYKNLWAREDAAVLSNTSEPVVGQLTAALWELYDLFRLDRRTRTYQLKDESSAWTRDFGSVVHNQVARAVLRDRKDLEADEVSHLLQLLVTTVVENAMDGYMQRVERDEVSGEDFSLQYEIVSDADAIKVRFTDNGMPQSVSERTHDKIMARVVGKRRLGGGGFALIDIPEYLEYFSATHLPVMYDRTDGVAGTVFEFAIPTRKALADRPARRRMGLRRIDIEASKDEAMTAENPVDHEAQREAAAKIRADLADNFNVTPGEPMFKDAARVSAMAGMFPRNSAGERQAVATDIYGLAIMDLPQTMRDYLRDVVVADWLSIFDGAEQEVDHFIPARETYHVSVAVVQDVAANDVEAVGVLGRPGQKLTARQREKILAEIKQILNAKGSIHLDPVGARVGADGTLIMVFEYDPVLFEIRDETIRAIHANAENYTGRPKPLVHITLSRTLNNPTVTPLVRSKLWQFEEKYASISLEDMGLSTPVQIKRIDYSHELRWMHTDFDFNEWIELGQADHAVLADLSTTEGLGLVKIDGRRLRTIVESQDVYHLYDIPLVDELQRLGYSQHKIVDDIISAIESHRNIDLMDYEMALENILREVIENAIDAFMQRADYLDDFLFRYDVVPTAEGIVIRFSDNGTTLFLSETSAEKRAEKKVNHNRYGGKNAGLSIIARFTADYLDPRGKVRLVDLAKEPVDRRPGSEFKTMLEIVLPGNEALSEDADLDVFSEISGTNVSLRRRSSDRAMLSNSERAIVEGVKRDLFDPYFELSRTFPYSEESLSQIPRNNFGVSVRDRFVRSDGTLAPFYNVSLYSFPEQGGGVYRAFEKIQEDFVDLPFANRFYISPINSVHLTLGPVLVPQRDDYDARDLVGLQTRVEQLLTDVAPYDVWIEGVTIDETSGRILAQVFPLPNNTAQDPHLKLKQALNENTTMGRTTITLAAPYQPLTAAERRQLVEWVRARRGLEIGRMRVSEGRLIHASDSFNVHRISETVIPFGKALDAADRVRLPKFISVTPERIEELADVMSKETFIGRRLGRERIMQALNDARIFLDAGTVDLNIGIVIDNLNLLAGGEQEQAWLRHDLREALKIVGINVDQAMTGQPKRGIDTLLVDDLRQRLRDYAEQNKSRRKSLLNEWLQNERRRFRVSGTIVLRRVNGQWYFLMAERNSKKDHGKGLFTIPSGKLEPDEDSLTAALRELHEEAGITTETEEVVVQLDDLFGNKEQILLHTFIVVQDQGDMDVDIGMLDEDGHPELANFTWLRLSDFLKAPAAKESAVTSLLREAHPGRDVGLAPGFHESNLLRVLSGLFENILPGDPDSVVLGERRRSYRWDQTLPGLTKYYIDALGDHSQTTARLHVVLYAPVIKDADRAAPLARFEGFLTTAQLANIRERLDAAVTDGEAAFIRQYEIELSNLHADHAVIADDDGKETRAGIRGMQARHKAGIAFIFGTGNNGTVIDANGQVLTENGILTELGHNILWKARLNKWIFTGRQTKGDRPERETGDVSFEDSFSGPNIARQFSQETGAAAMAERYITNLPPAFGTHEDLIKLIQSSPADDAGKKLRAQGIDLVLRAITRAVADQNNTATQFVTRISQDIGAALAAWFKEYAAEPWIENFILVSGVGEHFARVDGQAEDKDLFIRGIRQGLMTGLRAARDEEDITAGLDEERLERIAQGVRRSTMGWERELLAARLTNEEIQEFVLDTALSARAYSVGISLGGTKIGAGLINGDGNIVQRTEVKWRQRYPESAAGLVHGIVDQIAGLLGKLDDVTQLKKVGIAFAGPVDREQGIVGTPFKAPNLPFDNFDLRQAILDRLTEVLRNEYGVENTPLRVDIYNDNVAAALGEQSRTGRLFDEPPTSIGEPDLAMLGGYKFTGRGVALAGLLTAVLMIPSDTTQDTARPDPNLQQTPSALPATASRSALRSFFAGPWSGITPMAVSRPQDYPAAMANLLKQAEAIDPKLAAVLRPALEENLDMTNVIDRDMLDRQWAQFNRDFFIPNNLYAEVQVADNQFNTKQLLGIFIHSIKRREPATIGGRHGETLYVERVDTFRGRNAITAQAPPFLDAIVIWDNDFTNVAQVVQMIAHGQGVMTNAPDVMNQWVRDNFRGMSLEQIKARLIQSTRRHELAHKIDEDHGITTDIEYQFGLTAEEWQRLSRGERYQLKWEIYADLVAMSQSPDARLFAVKKMDILADPRPGRYAYTFRFIMQNLLGKPRQQWTPIHDIEGNKRDMEWIMADPNLSQKAGQLLKQYFPKFDPNFLKDYSMLAYAMQSADDVNFAIRFLRDYKNAMGRGDELARQIRVPREDGAIHLYIDDQLSLKENTVPDPGETQNIFLNETKDGVDVVRDDTVYHITRDRRTFAVSKSSFADLDVVRDTVDDVRFLLRDARRMEFLELVGGLLTEFYRPGTERNEEVMNTAYTRLIASVAQPELMQGELSEVVDRMEFEKQRLRVRNDIQLAAVLDEGAVDHSAQELFDPQTGHHRIIEYRVYSPTDEVDRIRSVQAWKLQETGEYVIRVDFANGGMMTLELSAFTPVAFFRFLLLNAIIESDAQIPEGEDPVAWLAARKKMDVPGFLQKIFELSEAYIEQASQGRKTYQIKQEFQRFFPSQNRKSILSSYFDKLDTQQNELIGGYVERNHDEGIDEGIMELLHEQYLALDPENKQQVNLHFLRTFQDAGFEEQKSVLILMYIWLNNFLTQSEFPEDLRARVEEMHRTVTGEPGILFTIAQDTSNLTDSAGKPVPEWAARTEGVAPTLRDQMQIMGIRFDIRGETVPTYIFNPDLLRNGTYADLMAFLINHLYGTIDIVRQPTASLLKRSQPSVYEVTSLADPFAQLRAAEFTVTTLTQMIRHPLFAEQYPDISHGLIKALEKQKRIITGLRHDLGLPSTDKAMISAAVEGLERFVRSADQAAFGEEVQAGQVREVVTPKGPVYLLQEHSHMGAEDVREFERRLNGPGLNKDYVYDLLASYSESGILQSLREDVVAYRKFIHASAGHAIVFAQEATPSEITISGSLRENYLAIAEHLRSSGIYEQTVIDAVYLLVQGVEAFLIGSGELHEDDVIFLPMEDEVVKAQENEALKRLLMSQQEFYRRAEELAYSDQVIQLLDTGMGDYIYAADQTQAEQALVHGIFAHTRDPQLLQIIKRRLYWVQHVLANGINRRNLYMARRVLASVQPHHKMIISVGQLHVDGLTKLLTEYSLEDIEKMIRYDQQHYTLPLGPDEAILGEVLTKARQALVVDEAYPGTGNAHLPDYLRDFQTMLVQRRTASHQELIQALIQNNEIFTVTAQTPLFDGTPLTKDNPVVWGMDSQVYLQPTRSIHLYPGDLRLKSSGGAYLVDGEELGAFPYHVTEYSSRSRAIMFGANERNLEDEMTQALSFAYLMETLWPDDGYLSTNIPIGIKRIKNISMDGKSYPVDDYFRLLARQDAEAQKMMEEVLARQLKGRRDEYPQDTVEAFVEFMRPAQMLDMQGSAYRVGLIRRMLLEDFSSADLFDESIRDRWRRWGIAIEGLSPEDIALKAKELVDNVFGEIMKDYQPLDVAKSGISVKGNSEFEIFFNAAADYRRQTLAANVLAAEQFYHDVLRDLGRYMGALWTVGGRADGGPVEERNVAIRQNRIILHDWDEGFVPNRESEYIQVAPGNIRTDYGMLKVSTFDTLQKLMGIRAEYASSTDRYFMEGVEEGRSAALGKILFNPGQQIVSDTERKLLVSDWQRAESTLAVDQFDPANKSPQVQFVRNFVLQTSALVRQMKQSAPVDAAVLGQDDVGGIDFNPVNMNLNEQGEPIPFNFTPGTSMPLQSIEGIRPVIIQITPLTNLPLLLGLSAEELLPVARNDTEHFPASAEFPTPRDPVDRRARFIAALQDQLG